MGLVLYVCTKTQFFAHKINPFGLELNVQGALKVMRI
jgi:hypothetical protein